MMNWEEFRNNYKPLVVQVLTEWQDEGGSIRDLAEYISAWIYSSAHGQADVVINLEDTIQGV
jgi:hypothetical protein